MSLARPVWLSWCAAGVTCAVAVCVVVPKAFLAHAAASEARTRLDRVTRDVQALAAIPEAPPAEPDQADGLTTRLTASIRAAGLPAAALSSVSPEARTVLSAKGGVTATRARATLTLTGLTLPQLGAFLGQWRASSPAWTPVTIDLAPQPGSPAVGTDLPLRATIALESISIRGEGDGP